MRNNYLSSWRPLAAKTFFMAIFLLLGFVSTADELQLLWRLAPGDRAYLTTGNTERGIAYNPATGHLLLVSRGDSTIYILDAANGAELGTLSIGAATISGGTFAMNMIGITDDGVIYLANLSTSTTAPNFKLYRWENEAAAEPSIAFEGDPSGINETTGGSNNPQRWGDSLDVRGVSTNAQILTAARNGSVAALISTTNGVDHAAKIISNASASGAIGIAFGAGNTFYTKLNGSGARHVGFDPETGAGTLLHTLSIANGIAPIGVNAASNLLAGVEINRSPAETPDNLIVYDISDLTQAPGLIDQEAFPGTADNANFVGAVDTYQDLIFALDTNNGLIAYRIVPTVNPPAFAAQPASVSVLEGGFASLSATIIGTKPFSYQWTLSGTNLPGATNELLTFTNITAAQAGNYSLIVSNSAGSTNSAEAAVTVLPSVRSQRATVLWALPPDSVSWMTTGNTERGLTYNVKSNHVLVISRTGSVDIHVLDADTGAELWTMNAPADPVSGSNPGGFRMNMIAAADDGAIYAMNLDTGGADMKIYRWEDDGTNSLPTIAFEGSPSAERYGDTFNARGSGLNTQLIAATRNGTAVAIFTTADGLAFTSNLIDTPDAPAGSFGLGVDFGQGDTFYGKATGPTNYVQHIQFDLGTGLGTILQTFTNVPSFVSAIGVNTASNLLAGISVETPDNLRLYDLSNTNLDAVLIDQDFFPTDNPNANATGSVDFGNDRVYALDTNNGILALKLNPGSTSEAASLSNPAVSGNGFSFTLTGTPNARYAVQYTTDFKNWTDLPAVTAGQNGKATVTDAISDSYRFYRALAE